MYLFKFKYLIVGNEGQSGCNSHGSTSHYKLRSEVLPHSRMMSELDMCGVWTA
jgi:hypothetical protein